MSNLRLAMLLSIALQLGASLFIITPTSNAKAGPYTDSGWDPTDMIGWATSVEEVFIGPMDIAAPEDGLAAGGAQEDVLGPATNDTADVITLGDGGFIVLGFEYGIGDEEGADFAVYENGFWSISGLFAEFAFVEVSTNGQDFARFDAITLRDSPVADFAAIDPTNYYNLAGDQPGSIGGSSLGTGFDLAELASHELVTSELLDLDNIQYVRVIDVIGDGSTTDSTGAPIFDPYATSFLAGGFDLNAVGAIHFATVPEPSSTMLMFFSLITLGLISYQRQNSADASSFRLGGPS